MASLETKLQTHINYLLTDPKQSKLILPKGMSVAQVQVPLYSPMFMFTKGHDMSRFEDFPNHMEQERVSFD